MQPSPEHIKYLWEQYITEKASPAELEELFGYIQNASNDEANQLISQEIASSLPSGLEPAQPGELAVHWQKVLAAREVPPVRRMHRWWWAAASILVLLAIGGYFVFNNNPSSTNTARQTIDVQPGKDGAILTLADGRQLVLDSMGNGLIATQNGSQVLLTNGQVRYEAASAPKAELAYNTMRTPRGRQFHLTLPDGSGVWLNAASSITYPVAFTGTNRKVSITGEVYFEVVKNAAQPFIVDIDGKNSVQVLGTRFNINSYADEESINTTLLEGSVQIVQGNKSNILKPGQQAVIRNEVITIHDDIDPDRVLAWKNGLFDLEGADVQALMRKLEKWYDINVRYEGAIPKKYFHGQLDRNVNLSEIMKILPEMGIQCRLEGTTLIVY